MTTMLKLLSTFSLAAVFSLSIAGCALDDADTQTDDIEKQDDTMREPLSPEVAERVREGLAAEQRKLPEVDEDIYLGTCTEDFQCESNICDQKHNVCL